MSEENHLKLKEATERDKRLVWHYTTWEGFESIIKHDELWASDWRFMNDKMELQHALEFCKGRYSELMPHVENLIGRLMIEEELPLAAFVLSTSTAFDLLEQWRGYGQSSIGVALAFDDQRLTKVLEQQGMRREPAVYFDVDKNERIESLIKSGTAHRARVQALLEGPMSDGDRHRTEKGLGYSYAGDMAEFMRRQALTFKDPRFKNESEVRFISDFPDVGSQLGGLGWPPADAPYNRGYRRRGAAVMPYVKLKLSAAEYVPGVGAKPITHPLVGILFGPTSEPQVLTQERYNIAGWVASMKRDSPLNAFELLVANSEVPLRA